MNPLLRHCNAGSTGNLLKTEKTLLFGYLLR